MRNIFFNAFFLKYEYIFKLITHVHSRVKVPHSQWGHNELQYCTRGNFLCSCVYYRMGSQITIFHQCLSQLKFFQLYHLLNIVLIWSFKEHQNGIEILLSGLWLCRRTGEYFILKMIPRNTIGLQILLPLIVLSSNQSPCYRQSHSVRYAGYIQTLSSICTISLFGDMILFFISFFLIHIMKDEELKAS